jgi:transcriptional regulator with XRE-family HTH domain
MKPRNALLAALPYAVESGLTTLGAQLKLARLRRNLSLADVAEKIGVSRFAVADAEKGKPTTGIAIYAALLWAYDLIGQLTEIADPNRDEEGAALALSRERRRAGRARPDNDF